MPSPLNIPESPDQNKLVIAVVVEAFRLINEHGYATVNETDLSSSLQLRANDIISRRFILKALETSDYFTGYNTEYLLTDEGIDFVLQHKTEPNQAIDAYLALGIDWLYSPENNNLIPASDRYVSVRDNKERFDQLETSLDEILEEFKRDHNKGEFALDNHEARLGDIEDVLTQIRRGWVRIGELRDGLLPTLNYIAKICVSCAMIVTAIAQARSAISAILGL